MKAFLKKIGLSDDEITSITSKYVEKHKDEDTPPTELPIHISKGRLDEVLKSKKELEGMITSLTDEKDKAAEMIRTLQDSQGKDFKDTLAASKKEWEKEKKVEIDAIRKDYEVSEAIMKAKGKNVKAIKALMDLTKPTDEEVARLVKDESYLFGEEKSLPAGTGKKGSGDNGDGIAEENKMRAAVGLPPIVTAQS